MFIGNEIIKNPSINILNGLKQIMFKAQNTVIVSDYIFNDAIEYDEVTENFKRELAIINKELAKFVKRLLNVVLEILSILSLRKGILFL